MELSISELPSQPTEHDFPTPDYSNEIITEPVQPAPPPKWIAFMFGIHHKHKQFLLDSLLKLDSVQKYIIGMETCPPPHHALTQGQHFHFMVQMSDQDYHRYSQKMIKHFHLQGRAHQGVARQYGKVKEISNIEKMKAYSVKDGNVITNITEKELELLRALSHEKHAKQKFRQKLFEYLNKHYLVWYETEFDEDPSNFSHHLKIGAMAKLIIKFYRENKEEKMPLSRSNIVSIISYFLMYHAETDGRWIHDQQILNFLGSPNEYI